MNRRAYAFAGSLAVAFVAATQAWSQGFVDPRTKFTDPGCTDMKLVSTGAPFPRDPSTLAVRWTGFSNWELAYKNEVLLLDVYIDRGATFMPLGYKAADVTRANAILIGHGHSDHRDDLSYHPVTNADAVAAAARALAPNAKAVIGMSLGGLTSYVLASRHPELVRKLIVIDVTPGTNREKASRFKIGRAHV